MAFNFIDPNASGLVKAVLGGVNKSVTSVSAGVLASAPNNSELSAVIVDLETGEKEAFHIVKGKVKSLTSQEWKLVEHELSEMSETFKKSDFAQPSRIRLTVSRDTRWNDFLVDYSTLVDGGSLGEFKEQSNIFKNAVLNGSWNARKFEQFV